jgi:hypothetical protein
MLQVEKIRAKHFRRNDLQNLDANKARRIKKDLRVGRSRIRKLSDGAPLKSEALILFDSTINAMDALINKSEDAPLLFEVSRECFELYVARMEGVM